MGIIIVNNIRCFAHHGCLEEETKIGSDYRVDVEVKADLEKSAETDQLSDTVDYVLINTIVTEEMCTPSRLLEHVAKRIINRFFRESLLITSAQVAVSKLNPPIGGDVENVTVILTKERKS